MNIHFPRIFALAALATAAAFAAEPAADFTRLREHVAALGDLKSPPAVHDAEGFAPVGTLKPIFFEGLAYQGKPTRVFAWLGLPANHTGKVPGVVLVHGGGGTAFKEWVQKWNEQGFAAISMAVLQHNTLDEKQRILPRIAAAIRPGGLFVMSESTVLEETRTQLTQEGWIRLVISHGFELLSTWHPNPEHGIDDAYMFRRGERLAKAPKRPK